MALQVTICSKVLRFRFAAGTSRGTYHTHRVWYVGLTDATGFTGWGECAPLTQLSCDDIDNYEAVLTQFANDFAQTQALPEAINAYPSMRFGLETAHLHLQKRSLALSDTPFAKGQAGIVTNGLIWMGDKDLMKARIEEKLKIGFECIKLKIGAINFDDELALLTYIRRQFSKETLTLRVDANGAFSPEEAPKKLAQLAKLDIHSIEQPIAKGQWEAMHALCQAAILPIALDEELISHHDRCAREALLDAIAPQYIVLKPTLHGGFEGTYEWIAAAKSRGIGYWLTSALESNIGLNAVAHLAAQAQISLPQGLGTGQIYENNIDYPVHIQGQSLWFNPEVTPDFERYMEQN